MMGGDYDLGQFKGRLKVGGAVVMGHSFGGATTIQALSEDNRFKWAETEVCVSLSNQSQQASAIAS